MLTVYSTYKLLEWAHDDVLVVLKSHAKGVSQRVLSNICAANGVRMSQRLQVSISYLVVEIAPFALGTGLPIIMVAHKPVSCSILQSTSSKYAGNSWIALKHN
jgi:hypothetical protein